MDDRLEETVQSVLTRAKGVPVNLPDPGVIREAARRRTRRTMMAGGGVGVLAVAAAMGFVLVAPGSDEPIVPTAAANFDTPLISYIPVEPEAMSGVSSDALLTRDQDCLFVDGRAVVWPEGSQWDPDGEVVTIDRGRRGDMQVAVGERFPQGVGGVSREFALVSEQLSDVAAVHLEHCIAEADSGDSILVITRL